MELPAVNEPGSPRPDAATSANIEVVNSAPETDEHKRSLPWGFDGDADKFSDIKRPMIPNTITIPRPNVPRPGRPRGRPRKHPLPIQSIAPAATARSAITTAGPSSPPASNDIDFYQSRCLALQDLVNQAAERITALEARERATVQAVALQWNSFHHAEMAKMEAKYKSEINALKDLRARDLMKAQEREIELFSTTRKDLKLLQASLDRHTLNTDLRRAETSSASSFAGGESNVLEDKDGRNMTATPSPSTRSPGSPLPIMALLNKQEQEIPTSHPSKPSV